MSKSNRSKLKSALKTFFAKRQGLSLESQVAILTLLVGASWVDGAQAAEGSEQGALPVARLSPAEQKAIAEIKALIKDGLTAEEIAQIVESTQQLQAGQVIEVLESLLSDETLAAENIDEMVEQLRAQLEQSRGEAIVLSPSSAKTKVAEEKKAIEFEYGADAPASGSSKVTVETPKEEDDDKGAVLLNSGDTLGLAPAFFAAGPLGPILGGVVGVAALAGGGGGGSSTPPLITQNGEAIDGYISGADVFVKAADGTLTKVGVTDELGQFEGLDGTPGLKLTAAQTALKLVVSGGIDISAGEPFAGSMEAPAGSLVVTPLTTILSQMMEEDPTLTIEQANDALVAKLGLAEGIDLTTLDPIQVASTMPPEGLSDEALVEFEANRLAALEVYQRGLAIITLAENASAVGTISFSDAFDSIVASISTNLIAEIDTVGLENVTSVTDTELVTVAVGGLADLNTDAFSGANLEAFIDAGKDVFGQIDLTVSVDDADSDRNEAVEGILGTFESELLEGNEINDLIVGFGGDDTLLGGDGDDTLLGGSGNDSLIGGAGIDTIFGSEGDDTVAINLFTESAGQSDSIELGSGIDVVEVQGEGAFNLAFNTDEVGNNDVKDSEGNLAVTLSVQGLDELATRVDDEGLRFVGVDGGTLSVNDDGQFSEVVLGSAEADTLEATVEAGNVYIQGGEGNDLLTGASGNDILSGDAGDDDVIAGAGNDSVQGGDGNDNLQGDDGDDTLIGGAGDDSIQGGLGSDVAKVDVSVAGSDSIDLGDGDDVISVTGADQVRITLDLSEVGDGSITNADSEFPVGIQAEDENGELTGDESVTVDETIRLVAEQGTKFDVRDSVTDEAYGDNFDSVTFGSAEGDSIFDLGFQSGNQFIATGAGNDTIYISSGDDYISGGEGNDLILDFGGSNTLSGGAGADVLYVINQGGEGFEAADSSLIGGEGNDLLLAIAGDNTLEGGAGNDVLLSGDGNDVARINLADDGQDQISLGAGLNTLEVEGDGEFRINLNANLVGDEQNPGDFSNGSNGNGNVALNVYLGLEDKGGDASFTESPGIIGGIGGENFDVGYDFPDTRTQDEGMRFVAVDGGTFDVRERSDSNPNEGAEIGNTFKVVSLGTVANDTLDESETEGDVYINGGAGSDSLVGGAGNDVLIGGREAAYLVPAGENVFTLLPDNDTFVGGLGDDHIIGNQGEDLASVDLTTDGNDTIELGIGDTIGNFGFSSGADTVSISGGSNVTITFDNTEVGDGSAFKEEDQLAVSLQADGSEFVVTTDDEAIRFESEGDETFTVKDDTVELGSGFDAVLLGGAGNDFINESESESTEKLFINGGEGNDFITSGAGDDLIFGGAGGDFISAGEGADVVYGEDGSDDIAGGAGNDTIFGGADADSFSVNLSTDGSDSVDLGTGFDSVSISGSANTRMTLDLAAVGNDDIHSSGDTLAVSVQSQDTPDGDILHIDDEGLRFTAQDMQGSVLVDAKFDVRDLDGNEVSPGDLFDEVVLGTAGDDYVADFVNKSIENFFGNFFNENFVPTPSPDVFVEGGMGNDTLLMADGDDFLSGGEGNDTMFGSAGDDTFLAGAGNDKIGTDAFSFGFINPDVGINTDESGDDVLRVNLETDGNDTVNLGSGADTVELTSTASTVRITFNADSVGNGGANDVFVQASADNKAGVSGNILTTDDELIRFVADEDTLFSLNVSGSALGDDFGVVDLGGLGDDSFDHSLTTIRAYINGGAGNDSIVGGSGNDVVFGGAGADLFSVNLDTDGSDVANLGSELDTVEVSSSAPQVRVSFDTAGVGQGDRNSVTAQAEDGGGDLIGSILTTDDEGIRFVAQDASLFEITTSNGTSLGDDFGVVGLGSLGGDVFDESEAESRVYLSGGQGEDILIGGSAEDILLGGAGNDVLVGGTGNDFIDGGEGNDDVAQFTEQGRELEADDVFTFDGEANTLTFTDNFGSSLEVDTLTGVEKLDFGQFNGNNQVFVTEAQLAVLNAAGVGFADNNDVTLIVDGSTLSESNLTLSDLQNLGIDHVLTDGPLVNIELGSGPDDGFLARITDAGGDIDSRLGIDFKVNSDSVEKDTAVVNLGLTSDQLVELFGSAPGGIVADNLDTIAGKDQFALIDGGGATINEQEAAALYGSDATASKLSISDHFATADGVGTQTSLTLDVSGSTISDNDLSLVDLARLGVDEISLDDTMTDTGFFVNIGIGEAIEQFATAYLADNAEDFSGALSDAVSKSVLLADSINNIEFSGGDFISEFIFADALSEDAAEAIKGLAATSDPAVAEFNNFEAALRGSLSSNLVSDGFASPDFVSVLVADATADGTVLADSELSAADLDDLGFDLLLLGDRDQSDDIVGYADLETLLADLGQFNLDTLTDNGSDGTDVDQDSIALVNIDPELFEAGSFELADLQALAALGLDAIAIGNSFDDFIANGDLDINDLINSHPDNLP